MIFSYPLNYKKKSFTERFKKNLIKCILKMIMYYFNPFDSDDGGEIHINLEIHEWKVLINPISTAYLEDINLIAL